MPKLNTVAVAAIAAALSSAVTMGAVKIVGAAEAQAPNPNATRQLMTQALSDLPGREVRMLELNRPPQDAGAPHSHPGHHTFGYVVDGEYEFGVNNGPTKILHAGDTFYEPPGAIHSASRNASKDKPMKIVVFLVADQSKPTTVPVK